MAQWTFGTMTDHPSSPSVLSSSFSCSFSLSSNSSPTSTPSSSPLRDAAAVPLLLTRHAGSKDHHEVKKTIQPLPHNLDFIEKRTDSVASRLDALSPSRRPLRPPPCLRHSSQLFSGNSNDHIGGLSNSLTTKRRHRKLKSKDDPFLAAMEVCAKKASDFSDRSNLSLKKSVKFGKSNGDYFASEEKEAIGKIIKNYSFKSLSFEGEYRDTSADRKLNFEVLEALEGKENSVHTSMKDGQSRSSPNDSRVCWCSGRKEYTDPMRLRRSVSATEKSRDIYQNLLTQVPTEQFCRSQSEMHAKSWITPTRKQSKAVVLSCGRHRRMDIPSFKGNKQAFGSWLGCRGGGSSDSVINPSSKSLHSISQRIY
eukprot:c22098_g1_i1 orf=742-1842(+)